MSQAKAIESVVPEANSVDPLVGRALELLGYDRTYRLTPEINRAVVEAHANNKPVWSKDVVRNGTLLITQRPVVLDVGAVAKGYLVDIVSELLRDAGMDRFVVDGSGDMRHFGESRIRIGLEHPFEAGMLIGVAELHERALCASAINRRAWGRGLHHVLDDRTGSPGARCCRDMGHCR